MSNTGADVIRMVIDRGNTLTKCAIFRGGEMLIREAVADADLAKTVASLRADWNPSRAILASVREIPEELTKALEGLDWKEAGTMMPLPIALNYETPETLGIDRLADAIGAYVQSGKKNALAIDCGTCITYNLVVNGAFAGGAISPGLEMRFRALHDQTARLPLVQGRERPAAGSNTHNSILEGVLGGTLAEMEGMIEQFCSKYDISDVFITGGDLAFFAGALKRPIFADPYLTLKGLNEILS